MSFFSVGASLHPFSPKKGPIAPYIQSEYYYTNVFISSCREMRANKEFYVTKETFHISLMVKKINCPSKYYESVDIGDIYL